MNLIDKVLQSDEFNDKPPVLLDIGASGAIHPKWKPIAKYSVCLAFDADSREMNHVVNESSNFKKLHVFNAIVTDRDDNTAEFYLTRSPYCSSLLQPDNESLANWSFSDLFQEEKTVKLKTITLQKALMEAGLTYVDWFKTDSQGTDLRLFKALGEEITGHTLIAEFEPGIIDAYKGEDKLWEILMYMEKRSFWMTKIIIRGSQRFNNSIIGSEFNSFEKRVICLTENASPGWGELTYMNNFSPENALISKREYLLGWVISMIEGHNSFAAELAIRGFQKFQDPIFIELKNKSISLIKLKLLLFPYHLVCRFLKRYFFQNKI